MRTKISKRVVDAAQAGAFLWDAGDGAVKGFGLKVTATSKVYILQYRMGGRGFPARRYTIGKHGSPWTPEQARAEARRLLSIVAQQGSDPAAEKAAARSERTVAELCDLYVAEGCATKKTASLAADRAEIERHIKPLIGARKARSLARADVERLMVDVAAGKTAASIKTKLRGRARVAGGQGMARKCVIRVAAIYSWAIDRGIYTSNPARGIKKYQGRKMERFLSAAELARLGTVLSAHAEKSPIAVAALRLLALTGCRKGEILDLEWDHVDLENGCLRLPDSKTGRKVVPIGDAVLLLLAALPRFESNPHVLPGNHGARYGGIERVWRDVRAEAGLDGVRIHDLRHSYASVGAAGGDSLLVIGAILGHSSASTTQRYAHLSNDPVRAAANRIAGAIDAALGGGAGEEGGHRRGSRA
jgi:integrase